MDVRVRPLDLTLATPFRISRSVQHVAANVLVEIEHQGLTGIGEAAPRWYYGERREMVLAALPHLSERLVAFSNSRIYYQQRAWQLSQEQQVEGPTPQCPSSACHTRYRTRLRPTRCPAP